MNATASRFRSRTARRVAAAVVAAAALGLGATACGQGSGSDGSNAAAGTSQSSDSTAGSDAKGASQSAPQQSASESASKPAPAPSARGAGTGASEQSPAPVPAGSGVANAGNKRVLVGTLEYLAPGKLIVNPGHGSTPQAFYFSNATTVLGAAAICGGPDGNVTIGKDGYGTTRCTGDELEKAAKMNSVTVRVTLDRKLGTATTVEEKYHP